MKKLFVILSIMIFAVIAYAAQKGPETIKMTEVFNVPKTTKKAVEFPHAFHQTKNECTECHMSPEGGKELKNINTGEKLEVGAVKGIMNPVHKNFCWACHTKKNVPQGKSCTKCHK
ncbi:MAG: cytochrome c3 family protein [Flexistipes sinusarabici]|uniref:Cytochrome c3 family protein n=1 Tax=Flexistipes sinusarabici TaxID=2352 RepID=A0A5D0MWY1_FLESI|nr:cytochrome c3 family protein [Flexistipes sinusarabici]TYB36680.1 MAG: cytochrome c3 family protein [Flexistipes sinusarabici]